MEEYETILKILPDNELCFAWIGATDKIKEGECKWVTGEPFSWSDWLKDEPSGGNEYYLLITNAYQGRWGWNNGREYIPGFQGYVCEWTDN